MNRNFKNAAEQYVGEPIDGIRPMSMMDGDIVSHVIDILRVRGGNSELVSILSKYKQDADDLILSELQEYCETLDEDGNDAQENGSKALKTIDFIQVGSELFQVWMLYKIRPIQEWDDGELKSYILLNEEPIPEKVNFLENKLIEFDSIEDRDNEIERLKSTLKTHLNVRFLS